MKFLFLVLSATQVLASDYKWLPIKSTGSGAGISVTGRVVPQDGALHIESARVQGRVLSIAAHEGDRVHAGTLLYEISSAECLSLAEEKRVAQSKQIDDLITGVAKRERQLSLKLQGDKCFLVADGTGTLTKRQLESGSSFNIGDPIATVLDTNRLTVDMDIPEGVHGSVEPGQKVTFHFASKSDLTFSTTVQSVVPAIDPITRTAHARLKPVKTNKNLALDSLVFGEIEGSQAEPLLQVPSSALVFYRDHQYVIAGGDTNATAVAVQVVSESDKTSDVRPLQAGTLKAGDLVATKDAIFLLRKLTSAPNFTTN